MNFFRAPGYFFSALTTLLSCTASAQRADSLSSDTAMSNRLDAFVVRAERLNQRNTVSEIVLDKKTIKAHHGLFEDPLRVVSLMPGVSRGGDLFSPSQIYVRGGAPDENLFLSNNAKIYFPYYFGGQKSVFNSDVIENIELITGGFPAKYGNALSSVLNVTTRDGNREQYHGLFSVGFYNSSLLAEGPIGGKASFIVAARRTYLDLFLGESASFPTPNFGDVTYKLSLYATKKHKIMLSGLSGYQKMDYFTETAEPGLADRLKTRGSAHNQSLQWQYAGDRLYSKLSLVNTVQNTSTVAGANLNLNIAGSETGVREDLEFTLARNIRLQTGAEAYRNYLGMDNTLPRDPREVDPTDTNILLVNRAFESRYFLLGSWLSASIPLFRKAGISAGLRHDLLGETGLNTFSPRLSGYYAFTPKTELRLSYSHHHQAPSAEVFSKNADIQAPLSIHYIAGIRHRISAKYAGWIEFYEKKYRHLITYDTAFNYGNGGRGSARGVELFLRKEDRARFSGWISYAFSVSRRQSNLDTQEYFFDFDQRHVFNLAAQYRTDRPQSRWFAPTLFSGQVRLESGRPYTPVLGATLTPSGWVLAKGETNSLRDPAYFNVNLHVEWLLRKKGRLAITSYVEVWNLTNNKNLLGRAVQYGPQYPDNVRVQEYYSTPLLPAGGFRFEF